MSRVETSAALKLRRRAKEIRKQKGIALHKAQELAAREAGFGSWHAFITTEKRLATRPQLTLPQFRILVREVKLSDTEKREAGSYDPVTGIVFSSHLPSEVRHVREARVLRRLFLDLHPEVPISVHNERESMKAMGRALAENKVVPPAERLRGVELVFKAWYARSVESWIGQGLEYVYTHPGFHEYARHLWSSTKIHPSFRATASFWTDLEPLIDHAFSPLGQGDHLAIRPGESYWAPHSGSRRRARPRGLQYHVVFGRNPRFRPPAAMSLTGHRAAARILKRLHHLTMDRPGVHNRVESVRSTLDDWLQKEYDYDALPNNDFHQEYYYGQHSEDVEPLKVLDEKQVSAISTELAKVESLVRDAYVDCRPRDEILRDIQQCRVALDRWYAGSLTPKTKGSEAHTSPRARRARVPAPVVDPGKPVFEMSAREAVDHSIRLLRAYLERYGRDWRRSMRRDEIQNRLRIELPYVLHKTNREGHYILVNRDYEPVGMANGVWVDYEKHPALHVRLSTEELRSIVLPPYSHGLFGDGSTPWRSRAMAEAYAGRLEKLRAKIA